MTLGEQRPEAEGDIAGSEGTGQGPRRRSAGIRADPGTRRQCRSREGDDAEDDAPPCKHLHRLVPAQIRQCGHALKLVNALATSGG
jgi:hypothetical protein